MIDLEDEKERILEQLAAMVADASAPAKDEGAAEPEVLRFEGALEQWSR